MRIFDFHTAGASPAIQRSACGAEWWANVSRSEMIKSHGDINLHFDKDERAFSEYGLVVHPLLATVTYLSDDGAATLLAPHVILDAASGGQYASEAPPGEPPCAMLVPPKTGRHLCFDGRWLHGAPAGYLPASAPYVRITFCVNIWINHRPGRCPRFENSPTLPDDPLVAPRLRLSSARGVAACREARDARIGNLRCDEDASDDACRLVVEQTDVVHELHVPKPGWLGTSGRPWDDARKRGLQAVVLHGDAIVLRPA